ncbi:MAG: restriction endonuclease subunit S [Cohnella sp.]|uniref:restriction endonuclease subunit S n=1 Tax=Cohnella sp. TaxID=1883426 RepID=UPI000E3AFD5F|nr:restriction endonuclease subunit S [Cohnella sp.]REK68380.1 MAG: restriction endonuclease subunit S [Cohnella sp.]
MIFSECIEINPRVVLEKGKEYPFIEMANVDLFSRSPKAIDIKPYSSGVKFQQGDTVIARIEPCLQNGKGFYVNELNCGFGSTEFLVFRPKIEDLDNRFLYYFLQTDYIRKSMIASMTGATGRQRVNNDIFDTLEITLPDINTQSRIADILSTYDDLIENNQKQIKLLEEAAMRLYKEWFVNLRFPGYETTEIIDGVPEGWNEGLVKDLGKVITGKTPPTSVKENYGGPIPFVKIPDMHGNIYPLETELTLSERGANTQRGKLIPANSLMVSCIATVGLVCIAHQPCHTNQQINSIILNDERYLYYAYFKMKGLKSLLEGVGSNGATMTNVNKTKFESLKIIFPDIRVIEIFNNHVEPMFKSIYTLSKQVLLLRQARDKLLSRLMSGEIEV